jgi:hypothetical protein
MASVYLVDSIYGSTYVNTSKEANRLRPGGEHPDAIVKKDAAEECNDLFLALAEANDKITSLRYLLNGVCESIPAEVLQKSEAGRLALKYAQENPLPPADAADRDGGRSYSG